jgi:hypothetical protein
MFVSQIIDEACEILATNDKTKVFRKLTQAVQILMESGHYLHTTAEADVCTGWDEQTITLPRGIEVPLGVNVDGSPTYFRGRLFQYHVNKGGMYNPVDWAWDDRGFVSTIMDIRQPSELLAISENDVDSGKQIRVIGTDSNNRELRTQLPDGNTVDGILINVHSQSDFPYGTIIPDGATIQSREVAVSPLSQLVFSGSDHNLSSGQQVKVTATSGPIPSPLINGEIYYVGVESPTIVSLYKSSLDAKNKTNKIKFDDITGSVSISFVDSRKAGLLTAVNFPTAPAIAMDTPNPVSFSVGIGTGYAASLPIPLISGAIYYANPKDASNVLVYSSFSDAQNETNPVLMTGNSGAFNTDIKKQINPQTTLKFAVKHYYLNGDEVQAFTSGGTLPAPLIAGQKYFVNVIDVYTITLHTNQADALASSGSSLVNPVTLTDAGTGVNALVKLIPATSTTGTQSQITATGFPVTAPSGSGASAQAVVVGGVNGFPSINGGSGYTTTPQVTFSDPPSPPEGSGQVASRATGYAVMVPDAVGSPTNKVGSIVLTNTGSGYSSAPTISFSSGNASATASIQTSLVSKFIITNGGSGYTDTPIVKITGGGGSGATATAVVDPQSNTITGINIITEGTGYTTTPNVTITPSTGVFVEFVSTGTLPAPLESGVAYSAQTPLNSVTGNFTIKTTTGSDINITSASTGNFFLALSRTFSVAFNNSWEGDFSGTSTGQMVYLDSDYLLPSGVSPNVSYYLRKLGTGIAQLYNSSANAINTSSTTGLIAITQIGTGQAYYSVRTKSYAKAYENTMYIDYNQYISDYTPVKISSSGSLPYPLVSSTTYLVSPYGEYLKIYDTNKNPIVFSQNSIPTLAIGQLSVNIERQFAPVKSTNVIANNSIFNTGDQIAVRPQEGDILPFGLIESTYLSPQYYYVRSIGENLIEIYDTYNNAINTSSTSGRKLFTNIGDTIFSKFYTDQILQPTLVKNIFHIEKPETVGYVSLYAFDNGRSNDMALIGQYHPSETNPKYRRIRIGKKCSWARIIYRVSRPNITSVYDYIPIENSRALLAAIHAVDLEDKDFFDQSQKYWAIAYSYLKNQNESNEGHAMQPPQINNITYGDYTDEVMF